MPPKMNRANAKPKKIGFGLKGRRKKPKRRAKRKIPKVDLAKLLYDEEINELLARILALEEQVGQATEDCDTARFNRDESKALYEKTVAEKDGVLSHMKKSLQYLLDKFVDLRGEQKEKIAADQSEEDDLRATVILINESSKKIGRELMVEAVLLKEKIKVLEDVKLLRDRIFSDLREAGDQVSFNEINFTETIRQRDEDYTRKFLELRDKMHHYITSYKRECLHGYDTTKSKVLKDYLRRSLDLRIQLQNYSEQLLVWYDSRRDRFKLTVKLTKKLESLTGLQDTLERELRWQKKVVKNIAGNLKRRSKAKTEFEKKKEECIAIQKEAAILNEKLEVIRSKLRDCDAELDKQSRHLSLEERDYIMKTKSSSGLINILRQVHSIIEIEDQNIFAESRMNRREGVRKLEEFFNIVDTSNTLINDLGFVSDDHTFSGSSFREATSCVDQNFESGVKTLPRNRAKKDFSMKQTRRQQRKLSDGSRSISLFEAKILMEVGVSIKFPVRSGRRLLK